MNKTKIITIICWCISALVLTGLALWFIFASPLFGLGGGQAWGWGWSIGGFEALSGPFNPVGSHSLAQDDFDSLSINWVSGAITIKSHDGNDIIITEFAQRDLRDGEEMSITATDSTVRIDFTEGNRMGRMPNKRLEVLLPYSLSSDLVDLSIRATSGATIVSDINARVVDLGATSGSTTLSNVHAESITLNCTSGAINITESSASTLRTSSTSGAQRISGAFDDMHITGTSGSLTIENTSANAVVRTSITSGAQNISGSFDSVHLRSTSGSLRLLSHQVPAFLNISNTSGNINITVPDDETITLQHTSTSGRFSSEVPVVMQPDGASFTVSSTSGNLTINELR